jgi:hypothetical protein
MKRTGEAIATSASLIDFSDLAMVSIDVNAWTITSPLQITALLSDRVLAVGWCGA